MLLIATVCLHAPGLFASPSIASLEIELKKTPNRLKIREALGKEYVRAKQYKKAIEILAPYSNEISDEGLIELAAAYENTGDSLNQIRVLKFFSEKDDVHYKPHYLLGLAYKKNKQLTEATKSLRLSISRATRHKPSYDALLEIFIETKQNYESRALLTDMIGLFGVKKEFLNQQCRLYTIDNFLTEALSTCKRAISQDPKFPDNHIYLAQAYYNQGNKSAAERIFRAAGRQFINSEFVQYAAGEFYLNEKNFSAAIRYLQTAVKINSEAQRSQLTLALALYEASDFEQALRHFDKSCKLDKSKESLMALKNSAARLRKTNNTTFAEQYDRKAAVCQQ